MQREIDEKLIINKDNSWTLTSILGNMMQLAEQLYGERDCRYTILGYEFFGQVPHIYFFEGDFTVIVRLGEQCLLNPEEACNQLAQEVIHLLAPVKEASVLEEGIATNFRSIYMCHQYRKLRWPISGRSWDDASHPAYSEAMELARELLEIDSDAIKKLRQRERSMSRFSPGLICDNYPSYPLNKAEELCRGFESWRKK